MVEGERRHVVGWDGELARKERRLADGLGVTWKDTEGFELHYRKTTVGQMDAGELRGLDTQS